VNLREYEAADRAALEEIHARRALSCEFPATDTPLVLVRLVLVGDHGRPVAALFGRLTVEIDLIIDSGEGAPRDRWNWIKLLGAVGEKRVWDSGLDSAVAFVAPEVGRAFGRRLGVLGFEREPNAAFRRRINEPLEWMTTT
jgi:hypothetical protein